eukprot:7491563-Alexandrium_andersonii.AAC.1
MGSAERALAVPRRRTSVTPCRRRGIRRAVRSHRHVALCLVWPVGGAPHGRWSCASLCLGGGSIPQLPP